MDNRSIFERNTSFCSPEWVAQQEMIIREARQRETLEAILRVERLLKRTRRKRNGKARIRVGSGTTQSIRRRKSRSTARSKSSPGLPRSRQPDQRSNKAKR